jgi:hypothetical protein
MAWLMAALPLDDSSVTATQPHGRFLAADSQFVAPAAQSFAEFFVAHIFKTPSAIRYPTAALRNILGRPGTSRSLPPRQPPEPSSASSLLRGPGFRFPSPGASGQAGGFGLHYGVRYIATAFWVGAFHAKALRIVTGSPALGLWLSSRRFVFPRVARRRMPFYFSQGWIFNFFGGGENCVQKFRVSDPLGIPRVPAHGVE